LLIKIYMFATKSPKFVIDTPGTLGYTNKGELTLFCFVRYSVHMVSGMHAEQGCKGFNGIAVFLGDYV